MHSGIQGGAPKEPPQSGPGTRWGCPSSQAESKGRQGTRPRESKGFPKLAVPITSWFFGVTESMKKRKSRTAIVLPGCFFFSIYRSSFQLHFKGPWHITPQGPQPPLTVLSPPCVWPGWPFTFTVFRVAECKPVPCGEQVGMQELGRESVISPDSNPCYRLWPSLWPWGGHCTSLGLCFPLCKMGTRVHTHLREAMDWSLRLSEPLVRPQTQLSLCFKSSRKGK